MKLALQSAIHYPWLGYGSFATGLSKGLRDIGVGLWEPTEGEYAKTLPQNYRTVVWASVPNHGHGSWRGQRSLVWSMWESDHLPEAMRCRLQNYDTVIVPNDNNVKLFSHYHPNVVKIPLGYDSTVWTYAPRPEPEDTFRFLFCGAGMGEKTRKGSDIALAAFLLAFPDWEHMNPSPRMVTKTLRYGPDNLPWVESHVGAWPVQQLVDLYRSCHAMILPSRGEGWGYHPQQAVATGIPAILTDIPGHSEYSWLPGFFNVSTTMTKAAYFLQGESGDWWEPDVDACVEGMRDVYNRYDHWKAEADKGGDLLREGFTHRHMAQALIDLIGADDLVECHTGEWVPFTERLYPLEVTRRLTPHDWNVGERTSFELRPGERYWVDAHVRQVMLDAGYCANAAEDHQGLLPEEVPA